MGVKSFLYQTQLLLCLVELSCGWVGVVTIRTFLKNILELILGLLLFVS